MLRRTAGPLSWWIGATIVVVIPGGLVWAVIAEERDTAAYLAMGAWMLLLASVVPRNTPRAPAWCLGLIAVTCAGAAVGFFRLYRWAAWPVMGYLDSISIALVSLQAVLVLLVKWSGRLSESRPKGMVCEQPPSDRDGTPP